ncbi:MAG: oxygen-independent coproporphyrinogen III oxidase [Betaproteobacteria bacterium]|nr:oxygen-independent coproporphyrinogen III oxidase [Betaproteobacteria bacterium]
MLKTSADQVPVLTEAMLRRLDRPGPRYTSYPTADRFVEAFGPADYAQALAHRVSGAVVGGKPPLSIYVHIPFCESVCYYCACNKVITKHHERAAEYLEVLALEVALNVSVLGGGQAVTQLHLGGGTPTFLGDAELSNLMAMLGRAFRLVPGAEVSIEVDPRTASPDRLRHFAKLGFNRLSFGVQDFDADVQKAVHRVQPFESVRDLMLAAREIGFESINADLIYGLPKQTPESFARTVHQVAELRPDRIALYAYAHLPQRFKPQRRIVIEQLPPPDHRVQMLGGAMAGFVAQGYTYIGMDHFALPEDSLAVAKRQGRLHRNFQGYSTQPDCDLVALGVSAIGRMGATYSQNAKTLDEYYDAVRQGQFPVVRGLALTRDDLVRRAVVMALMCQGRLEFEAIELAHLIRMKDYFKAELAELAELQTLGLCELTPESVQVTATGWYFVRAVAMVFDRHLRADKLRERFSRII